MARAPRIVAFLGTQTLGDFIMYHLTAASVARSTGGRLMVVYRRDRPYKDLLTLMNPHVAHRLILPDDPARVAPLDWFFGGGDAPATDWAREGFDNPDLFLTPTMLDMGRCLTPVPTLRLPADLEPGLAAALVGRGLRPDRWFMALHMREPFYPHRPHGVTPRNVDPATYLPLVAHVIRNLGGQVVRLGDPSMTPLPDLPGLIDLSRDDDGFPLQTFALSRARFAVMTDSGPTQLASALGTPTATTNACGIGVWRHGDLLMTKAFTTADGRVLDTPHLIDMGGLTLHTRYPLEIDHRANEPERLAAVADHMLAATADGPGWRAPAAGDPPAEPQDTVPLPLPWRHIPQFADLTVWEPAGAPP